MKKCFLALFFVLFLLIPYLAFSVSAEDANINLSSDCKTLEYNGTQYVRFNAFYTQWEYKFSQYGVECNSPDILYADFEISTNSVIICAYIYYADSSVLTAYFIDQTYAAEHAALSGLGNEYTVDFGYPTGNTINVPTSALFGNATTLTDHYSTDFEMFDVVAENRDGSFSIKKGVVLKIKEKFYYLDYQYAGIYNPNSFYPSLVDHLPAYEITDPAFLLQLEASYSKYNSLGLLSENIQDIIAGVLLILTFAVIPLAALIVFLILALRAITPVYKKIFSAIYITAAAELVVFGLVAVLLSVLR